MNTETGEIKLIDRMTLEEKRKFMEMKIPPTPLQLKRGKVGRNELCPCGSGKKFKNCCWTGK